MAFANNGAMFHRQLVYKDVGVAPGCYGSRLWRLCSLFEMGTNHWHHFQRAGGPIHTNPGAAPQEWRQ